MRNVTEQTLADAVKATFNGDDERTQTLLCGLVDHIHAFAREHRLTHGAAG